MSTLLIEELFRIQGFAWFVLVETQKAVLLSRGSLHRARCKLEEGSYFTICYDKILESFIDTKRNSLRASKLVADAKATYEQVKLLEHFSAAALQYLEKIMEFAARINENAEEVNKLFAEVCKLKISRENAGEGKLCFEFDNICDFGS